MLFMTVCFGIAIIQLVQMLREVPPYCANKRALSHKVRTSKNGILSLPNRLYVSLPFLGCSCCDCTALLPGFFVVRLYG